MASLAEALAGGPHEEAEGGGEAPDYDKHGEAAMEEFISAIGSKDAKAAWEAFKTVAELCEHAEGKDGEDDGEGSHAALMLIPHKG
jgi:hypothetical protein